MNALPRRFANVPDTVTALLLADDDFAQRAEHLLAAYMDASFHADAVMASGDTSPTWGRSKIDATSHAFAAVKRVIVDAMDDLRATVAAERGLCADDIITTRRLIAEHAKGRVPIAPFVAQMALVADYEGRN